MSARFEDRLRVRSGWRPELIVPERPDPKVKCIYAEIFEQRIAPLLTALPEQAAKVPPEQIEVLFNQVKVHIYDAWEICTLEAPTRHTNAAGRRAHPCVDDSLKATMRRLRELRIQLIVPRLTLSSPRRDDDRAAPPLVLGIECALPTPAPTIGFRYPSPTDD